MRSRKFLTSKVKVVALMMILVMSVLAGCQSNEPAPTPAPSPAPAPSNNESSAGLTGTINSGGSTSVEKAALSAMDEFAAINPGVTFAYDSTGSSTGITNGTDGTYSLGFSSRDLRDSEKVDGLIYKTVAIDGIAVVLHPSNTVENITMEQLTAIYKGEITNWSELGGSDNTIVVVSREQGSGTRGAYEEIVDFQDRLVESAIIRDGNGNVATYVMEEPNAIGYVSFTTLQANEDRLKAVKIDGAEATVENVVNGAFKVSRPFIMVYREENLNEAERAFVEFVFTEDGQNAIEATGVIKVK